MKVKGHNPKLCYICIAIFTNRVKLSWVERHHLKEIKETNELQRFRFISKCKECGNNVFNDYSHEEYYPMEDP